jgi:hypothetical protein
VTPYDLEERKRLGDEIIRKDPSQITAQIYMMLRMLLQHEADKEAERCLARHHAANED